MLRYLTAGESHGIGLVGILDGLPSGLRVDTDFIDEELRRRQSGYGRGARMKIEKDKVRILAGIRKGVTIGSPIAVYIENKDYKIDELHPVTSPRPGHADLAGYLKYDARDIRDVLERASARETAVRTALGGAAKLFLKEFSIKITSCVIETGNIKKAIEKKDTAGGIFEVISTGVPCGLGSYVQWDRRLDTRLGGAVMGIPGVKGVEIGMGFKMAGLFGSQVHDPIYYNRPRGFYRKTNNCGGIEGGMSNGEPILLRAVMKPIATLMLPLPSVDITTRKPAKAAVERADVCVVESAGVVAEAVIALELACVFLEKFGGDSLKDVKDSYRRYMKRIR